MLLSRRHWLLLATAPVMPARAHSALRDSEREIYRAINVQRGLYGLPELAWSDDLAYTARQHSARMLTAGFFAHRDPVYGDIAQRISAAGVRWSHIAENIFKARGYPDMVAMSVVEWMYSPGHRRNILNEVFLETGVGVAISRDKEYFITQQFLLSPE